MTYKWKDGIFINKFDYSTLNASHENSIKNNHFTVLKDGTILLLHSYENNN